MIRGALTYGAVSILLSVGFQAKGSMEKSMVADNDSGKSVASQARTSSGTFLAKREVINLLSSLPWQCAQLTDIAATDARW